MGLSAAAMQARGPSAEAIQARGPKNGEGECKYFTPFFKQISLYIDLLGARRAPIFFIGAWA